MDLLERGRTLHELGRTMTWSDIAAFLRYAPPSSHFWEAENPDQARQVRWLQDLSTPVTTILGTIADVLEADQCLRVGQQPPERGIVARLAAEALGGVSEEHTPPREETKKPQRSAAEIRALVNARAKK